MKRAIFLDRDNTIIQNDGDLGNPEDVRLIRGAAHAIGSLRQLGYRIIVVSNQGGVARGRYTERDVDAVHERVAQMVHDSAGAIIDRFYYCPFHPDGTVEEYAKEHPWRKPQPGMLLEAARSLDLELGECWMVGDQDRDIEAGRAAGCQTILITRKTSVNTKADFQAGSLAEAAAIIAQNRVRPRQLIPAAPTVVISPAVSREVKAVPVRATEPRGGFAGAEQSSVERPIATAQPLTPALEQQASTEGVQTAEVKEEEIEADLGGQPTDASEADLEQAENEIDESAAETPTIPRQDPFRHIPLRVQGVERPRRERGQEATPSDRLLTELLGEIRSWRHGQREFTPAMMLGSLASIALVMVAVLLGVYLEPATATTWIGATIVAQLGVIVLVLLNLRR